MDLPLDATGFRTRPAEEILSSVSAIPVEKCVLLSALATAVHIPSTPVFATTVPFSPRDLALPSAFSNVLVVSRLQKSSVWLDPAIEIAPVGVISATLRGKPALLLAPSTDIQLFENVPLTLPYASSQKVSVDSVIAANGTLTARVKYLLRGDNELLLRLAFHKAPQEKWKDVAQLLAISDGFRGEIINVIASDPYVTTEPFQVEYEISQPQFLDWSKKPVRIPVLLPLPGLPDLPSSDNMAAGKADRPRHASRYRLDATIHLPDGLRWLRLEPVRRDTHLAILSVQRRISISKHDTHGHPLTPIPVARNLRYTRYRPQHLPARRAIRPGSALRSATSRQKIERPHNGPLFCNPSAPRR